MTNARLHTAVAAPLLLVLALAPAAVAGDHVIVGEALSVEAVTPIAELATDPDRFADQLVRVEGEVTGVCRKAGCWMEVADGAGHAVRVQVEDGVLVFPAAAEGGTAAVEGKVEVVDMERDAYVAWQSHLAEDAGEAFDEASVGDGPYRLVRLRGHGAEIELQRPAG
jgi:hypothetical protein